VYKRQLYEDRKYGEGVHDIDAIKRLLQDLPLKASKRIASNARKPSRAAARSRATPAVRPVEPVIEADVEEPLVIMAPEDITGSIIANNGSGSPVRQTAPTAVNALVPNLGTVYEPSHQVPSALSNIPSGVVVLRR